MATEACEVVLETDHVTVRARLAVIEIEQRGSWDTAVAAGSLVAAAGGAAGLLTSPVSVATYVLAPFVLLLAVVGSSLLAQRWLMPAVHLDCVAWTAGGNGLLRRRSFGGPPRVHTAVARGRYPSTDVVLSADNRSTVIVGRVPPAEAEEVARALRRLVRERTHAG